MNRDIKTPRYVIDLARNLRVNLTPAENILWQKLRNRQLGQFKFRNQHPIYRYILDFYCFECKLAIEIDGDIHENKKDYDQDRDNFLKSLGIETMRFTNDEITGNIDKVIENILSKLLFIKNKTSQRPPLGDLGWGE